MPRRHRGPTRSSSSKAYRSMGTAIATAAPESRGPGHSLSSGILPVDRRIAEGHRRFRGPSLSGASRWMKPMPIWQPDRQEWIAIALGLAVALALAWVLFGYV